MPVLQQASNWSRFASVNKTNLRHNFYMLKKPKIKAINIKETTTPTQGTLYCIRVAHLLSILSSDPKEADRLGSIEFFVTIGSVQSHTETVSSRQR